jgi:hypothetical protein
LAKTSDIVIDENYLTYIRSLPCVVCGSASECDHLRARGSRESKRDDRTCIPLCREHHAERHQGGNEKFEKKYKINLWKEAWSCVVAYFRSRNNDEEAAADDSNR